MNRPTEPLQMCRWRGDRQVRVTEAGPQHRLVQTISYPFPAELLIGINRPGPNAQAMPLQLIKVRMVPGDPTTLAKLPLDELELDLAFRKAKVLYLHYAQVWNLGPSHWVFPSDMIRRDHCQLVDNTLHVDDEQPANRFAPVDKLMVVQVSVAARRQWTSDRWRSFGWQLEPWAKQVLVGGDVNATQRLGVTA